MSKGAKRILSEAAFEVLAKAKALEREGREILHFEIGEPDFDTPENIVNAAKEALDQGHTHYVPSDGDYDLKAAVCDEVENTRGYRPEMDQVLIVPGGKPTIFFPMVTAVDPGDEVIYPDPGFPTYGSLALYLGAVPVPVPLKEENEFRLSPGDLEAKITPKTKLIIVNSPQNPTGSVMTPNELERLAEVAEEHDIFLLSDEIYSHMTYDVEHASPTVRDQARERSILGDGFSKSHAMTGWRLGYIVCPAPMAERAKVMLINTVSCTNAFVQRAGIEGLKHNEEFINHMMSEFRIRRDAIVTGLNSIPGIKCLVPQGAFYAFPNIKSFGMTSDRMADFLMEEAGVACLPGTAFGPYGEGYLRFSYACGVDTINRAVEKIKDAVEKL